MGGTIADGSLSNAFAVASRGALSHPHVPRMLCSMRGILVRVGIDQAFGGWNAPVDPVSLEFAYVPIPDGPQRPGLETTYSAIMPALARFDRISLPAALKDRATHLDPDFERL